MEIVESKTRMKVAFITDIVRIKTRLNLEDEIRV